MASFILPSGRPAIMGILNATPDSFSDGGSYDSPQSLVDAGLRMVDEGADLLDLGGESTRPGAPPVLAEEEWRRVGEGLKQLAKRGIAVSIDTQKAEVAERALDAGAFLVNDVGGLRDPEMQDLVSRRRCAVAIMHMQGTPQTMQAQPQYHDVVREVAAFLAEQARMATGWGIEPKDVWIDPGIGFGKTLAHNLALIKNLKDFVQMGFPVLLGVSRKGFIGNVLGGVEVHDRLEGTLAVQAWAQIQGVRVIRVHDVLQAARVSRMLAAIGTEG